MQASCCVGIQGKCRAVTLGLRLLQGGFGIVTKDRCGLVIQDRWLLYELGLALFRYLS